MPFRGTWSTETLAMLIGSQQFLEFHSQPFLIFYALVLAVYWLMPRQQWRVYLLLAASFFFYAYWSKWLAIIVCVSTCMDYVVARWMEATPFQRLRRGLLALSLG